MRWRWQEDNAPGTPWENMARDEALFEQLQQDESALPIVRVYRWDRPSVSIGRLQHEQAVHDAFPGLPSVRRPTGGRAVVHGSDITISVAVRDADLPGDRAGGVMSSYRQIVGGVLQAFCRVGVSVALGSGQARTRLESVDCFALSARCDVVESDTGRKVAGCAQRRQHGVLLQQMSIPLTAIPDGAAFRKALKAGFEQNLGVTEWVLVDRLLSV